MSDRIHRGQVMPKTSGRQFAYEDEYVSRPAAVLTARHNDRRGVKARTQAEEAERKKYSDYELTIRQHTGTSLEITLRKERRDIVEQRKAGGKVVTHDVYQVGMSFAELVNLIFSPKCLHFEDEEHYPQSIHDAMKTTYTK